MIDAEVRPFPMDFLPAGANPAAFAQVEVRKHFGKLSYFLLFIRHALVP